MLKKKTITAASVTTRQLTIEDSQGRPRLLLDTNPDGNPNMRFLDAAGHTRLDVFLRNDGEPIVNINEPHGKGRIVLGLRHDGTCFVEILDSRGLANGNGKTAVSNISRKQTVPQRRPVRHPRKSHGRRTPGVQRH